MENASLASDVWDNVTSSSTDDERSLYLANIRDLALKVIYIIIGTVGILDNLFVLIVFILFIKITEKVQIILITEGQLYIIICLRIPIGCSASAKEVMFLPLCVYKLM